MKIIKARKMEALSKNEGHTEKFSFVRKSVTDKTVFIAGINTALPDGHDRKERYSLLQKS